MPGTMGLTRKICSHQAANKYFIDSMNVSRACNFSSYEWDGTHEGAQRVINRIKNNEVCVDCPEMGINASKDRKLGIPPRLFS